MNMGELAVGMMMAMAALDANITDQYQTLINTVESDGSAHTVDTGVSISD